MPIAPHPLFTPVSSTNPHSSHQSSSAFNRNSAQQQYLKLMDKIEKLKKLNKKLALEKDKVEVEKQMLMRENERLKGKNLAQLNLDEILALRKNVENAIKSIDEAKVRAAKFPNLAMRSDRAGRRRRSDKRPSIRRSA